MLKSLPTCPDFILREWCMDDRMLKSYHWHSKPTLPHAACRGKRGTVWRRTQCCPAHSHHAPRNFPAAVAWTIVRNYAVWPLSGHPPGDDSPSSTATANQSLADTMQSEWADHAVQLQCGTLYGKQAHKQLIRKYSATIILAYCPGLNSGISVWTDLHFKRKKKSADREWIDKPSSKVLVSAEKATIIWFRDCHCIASESFLFGDNCGFVFRGLVAWYEDGKVNTFS